MDILSNSSGFSDSNIVSEHVCVRKLPTLENVCVGMDRVFFCSIFILAGASGAAGPLEPTTEFCQLCTYFFVSFVRLSVCMSVSLSVFLSAYWSVWLTTVLLIWSHFEKLKTQSIFQSLNSSFF